MYFNLRNKFVKRKTFVNLFNFCMGRCGIRSCRFSQRFKQISINSQMVYKFECFLKMKLQIRVLKSV